jgi:type IV secretory pathway VirB4 component
VSIQIEERATAALVAINRRRATRQDSSDEDRLATMGLRSLADLLAPSSLIIADDHLVLDGHYFRVLAIGELPPIVAAGWLNGVLAEQLPVDLSLHIHPLDPGSAAAALKLKSWRLGGALSDDAANGRPLDNNLSTALEQIERLRRGLARRETALFSVGLYLQLHTQSRAELDDLTRRVASVLGAQAGSVLVPRLQQEQAFRACLPEARDPVQILHTLDNATLSTVYPFAAASPRMPGGILFGVDEQIQDLVELDLFDHRICQNANIGIFAPSGGGKTFFTKVLARRYLLMTDNTDVIVIDRKHEYRDLCDAMDGQFLRVAASSPHRINPFDLPPPDPSPEGSVFLDHIQQVLGLLDVLLAEPGQRLSLAERAVLDRSIREAYETAGITADPESHSSTPPTMTTLQAVLDAEADVGTEKSSPIAAALAERLAVFTGGSLAGGLLAGQTNVSLSSRLVVFGIEDLPEDLWSFAMYLIAGCVWRQVRQHPGRQRLLVVDEAWLLLQHPQGGGFLESIVRLARSYGLGLVFITQDVRNVLRDPRGSVIAENVFTTLLLRQSSKSDHQTSLSQQLLAEQFGLSAEEQRMLGSAQPGHGLLLVGPWRVHLHVVASSAEQRIAVTAPRERQALAASAASEASA